MGVPAGHARAGTSERHRGGCLTPRGLSVPHLVAPSHRFAVTPSAPCASPSPSSPQAHRDSLSLPYPVRSTGRPALPSPDLLSELLPTCEHTAAVHVRLRHTRPHHGNVGAASRTPRRSPHGPSRKQGLELLLVRENLGEASSQPLPGPRLRGWGGGAGCWGHRPPGRKVGWTRGCDEACEQRDLCWDHALPSETGLLTFLTPSPVTNPPATSSPSAQLRAHLSSQ